MFKNTKNKIVDSILMLGLFTSFVSASVPNTPGSYIGVTKIDSSSVTITFKDNSNNETGFKIVGDINATIGANDEAIDPNVYTDATGLICDKVYKIKIIAFNTDGESVPSDTRAFNMHTTFGVVCPPVTLVPVAPGPYVGVTKLESGAVTINFQDNSDNETGFKIVGDINATLPANDETLNPNVYTNVTGLICNKLYQFEVIAFNADGDSAPSDNRAFNMHTTFNCPCSTTTVPAAPGPYVGVTDINKTAVRINFADNSNNETEWRY